MKYIKIRDSKGRLGMFPLNHISHFMENESGDLAMVMNMGIIYTFDGLTYEKAMGAIEDLICNRANNDGVLITAESLE